MHLVMLSKNPLGLFTRRASGGIRAKIHLQYTSHSFEWDAPLLFSKSDFPAMDFKSVLRICPVSLLSTYPYGTALEIPHTAFVH